MLPAFRELGLTSRRIINFLICLLAGRVLLEGKGGLHVYLSPSISLVPCTWMGDMGKGDNYKTKIVFLSHFGMNLRQLSRL